jgi:2-polyprenyl-3-methyl-5-hydroxy-6-metoxy-1,4-benzoquinol methylase
MRTFEALGHVVGRISKRYYFEDFVRVYPDGQTILPLRLKRRATKDTVNNYLNHVKFYRFAAQFVWGRIVADVGCGTGYGSEILSKAGAVRVRACDASRRAIAFARSHYGASADFSVQGITDMRQFDDDSFDVSIANEVLEHIKEYGREEAAIAEMNRITRPGGLLVIGTPNAEMMPDHGFSYEEIRSLFERNFQRYRLFENALVPPGKARSLWAERQAKDRVGTVVSERIDLSETVWSDPGPPEIKVGLAPGPSEFATYAVDTALLHNTHSWVVLALNEKAPVNPDKPSS